MIWASESDFPKILFSVFFFNIKYFMMTKIYICQLLSIKKPIIFNYSWPDIINLGKRTWSLSSIFGHFLDKVSKVRVLFSSTDSILDKGPKDKLRDLSITCLTLSSTLLSHLLKWTSFLSCFHVPLLIQFLPLWFENITF
jgi:hypothetical protein